MKFCHDVLQSGCNVSRAFKQSSSEERVKVTHDVLVQELIVFWVERGVFVTLTHFHQVLQVLLQAMQTEMKHNTH